MTELSRMLTHEKEAEDTDIEAIDIDNLISDILIIKAEAVKHKKIFNYADYIERQLFKLKRRQAVLEL